MGARGEKALTVKRGRLPAPQNARVKPGSMQVFMGHPALSAFGDRRAGKNGTIMP